jgi:hypothetical protein
MFRTLILGTALIVAATVALQAKTKLYYLEFNTATYEALEKQLATLELAGLRAAHIFPPNAVIAEVPAGSFGVVEKSAGITTVVDPERSESSVFDPANRLAFDIWRGLIAALNEPHDRTFSLSEPPQGCVELFSPLVDSTGVRSALTAEREMFTSNFMMGRVAVNVILMESNGGSENWQVSQITRAEIEIVDGLDYLRQEAEDRGINLSWVYEFHERVPTGYEPIEGQHVPYYDVFPDPHWEFSWINDALSFLGYSRDKWDGVFDMANAMRRQYQANWAFSVFVVMDENDADHKFSDGWFAYAPAYYNSPGATHNSCFIVMTYNLGNYHDPFFMHAVTAHETGHIFRAPDEYASENTDCGNGVFPYPTPCVVKYGYLQVMNLNCESCNLNSINCLMKNNEEVLCPSTIGHFGWPDSDADGVADAIDPNNGDWMSIPDVNPGDLVRIYTLAQAFVNLIAVTPDNMATQPVNYVLWDGHNYDDQVCVTDEWYYVTINDGEEFQRRLRSLDPVNPVFTGINYTYTNGRLNWSLNNSFAYVRCFIYNASNSLIARPIWDKLYSANYPQSLDVSFLPLGQTYTAKFFGWCPDGGKSQTMNYSFTPCTSCGDANSDEEIDISDAVFIISYAFSGGPAPADCNYPLGKGDADGGGTVDISDALYLIAYIYSGGPCPHCKDAPCW